ncbi:hypothetical protein [Actinoplanes sp. NPDC051851]|uniref:hypothetical protein n=1 Tax=Actinoplanes sp. NPDC051851 TaxID=3154753 RepID=UPI003430DD00
MTVVPHVPRREIVARVRALPDVTPERITPLLVPMWEVDVVATVREAYPYDVLDRYLARAIADGELTGPEELAGFYGMETGLVRRVLAGMAVIGHLDEDGRLTALGRRSVADGRRYLLRSGRRMTFRFDGFEGGPVPRVHGTGSVWLRHPELTLRDGTRFAAVPGVPLASGALDLLLARPDLSDFSGQVVPVSAEISRTRPVWLPVYLVTCREAPPLAFVKAVDGPDPYLADLLGRVYRGTAGEPVGEHQ